MKNLPLVVLLICVQHLSAQQPEPERLLDFNVEAGSNGYEFTPVMPPLLQKAGAPKAYWTYFWEFGDGSFSREAFPMHAYSREGDFTVSLDATAHYDDGKKPRKKNKPLNAGSAARITGTQPPGEDVFDPKMRQMVAMYSYSKPKAGEEITLVVSYRNLGLVPTDGRLHLFFNEKKFPTPHFAFVEARTHHGELVDMGTSQVLPMDNTRMMGWVALPVRTTGGVSTAWPGDLPTSTIIQDMLNTARGVYREENAWKFTELQPGEKRNFFVSLAGTPNMLRDTNAFIHLEAVFAPFDPAVAPEKFVYEIEIVGSHDPNAIAVSDNRVNYRVLGSKKLDYKIQFQNNGEGPASTVEVKVEVPAGLKMGAMRPVDWYPKCPICPKAPSTQGCLDTVSRQDGLVFTFRNIYLPGSRQKDVDNRDSTKGFVKYRIEADRDMPKKPFRSRARIVFDKNPPIYTNYTRTGFKVGKSPGLKAGYGFDPDDRSNGYGFIGVSLSPYKSWRVYPQLELLAGLKGRSELPVEEIHTVFSTIPNPGINLLDTALIDTIRRSSRGFVSFEIPVLIRKNFTRFFGLGLGASARIILESGETKNEASRSLINWEFMDTSTGFMLVRTVEKSGNTETTVEDFKATRFRYAIFGDMTFGAVRAGPNLGIRGGVILGEKNHVQPFVQVSLELKL